MVSPVVFFPKIEKRVTPILHKQRISHYMMSYNINTTIWQGLWKTEKLKADVSHEFRHKILKYKLGKYNLPVFNKDNTSFGFIFKIQDWLNTLISISGVHHIIKIKDKKFIFIYIILKLNTNSWFHKIL